MARLVLEPMPLTAGAGCQRFSCPSASPTKLLELSDYRNGRRRCGAAGAAIAEVERRYTLYRNIPYEADAHEVGDAAEQAFEGWP